VCGGNEVRDPRLYWSIRSTISAIYLDWSKMAIGEWKVRAIVGRLVVELRVRLYW
jgi:hypothetical protein